MGPRMTVDKIEEIIRRDHGGAWWALFHQTGHGHKFLPTGHVLTAAAYDEIRRRFGGSASTTPAERQRNKLRAISDRADEGRRYGR